MSEVIFLIVLGVIWTAFASVQDLKKREVANWLSFSLIIFAMGFRLFYSLFSENFNFFIQGLIGLGIFFAIGNIFYYGRIFAGGDAKLMIAMGSVLPFSENFFSNLNFFVYFIFIFFFVGAFYSLTWSIILCLKNFKKFKKEFLSRFEENKKIIYLIMSFGTGVFIFGFYEILFFFLGILIFIIPVFYFYAKAVDEACMIKKVKAKELTEGDWLYEDIIIGKKKLKAKWDGLSKDEIKFIQRNKKEVLIRYGIPFVPVFLISFLMLLIFYG